MPNVVQIADMRTLAPHAAAPKISYDALILDMPYNLCSVLPEAEKLGMLQTARRLARRVVIVTTEQIDALVREAGFHIDARCSVNKGNFSRQILVCL
ncbi:hypothetical protein D3C85_1243830 [compost metagenome]